MKDSLKVEYLMKLGELAIEEKKADKAFNIIRDKYPAHLAIWDLPKKTQDSLKDVHKYACSIKDRKEELLSKFK